MAAFLKTYQPKSPKPQLVPNPELSQKAFIQAATVFGLFLGASLILYKLTAA